MAAEIPCSNIKKTGPVYHLWLAHSRRVFQACQNEFFGNYLQSTVIHFQIRTDRDCSQACVRLPPSFLFTFNQLPKQDWAYIGQKQKKILYPKKKIDRTVVAYPLSKYLYKVPGRVIIGLSVQWGQCPLLPRFQNQS